MIATVGLGDYAAIAGLVALAGGQVVMILQSRHNRERIIEVHEKVERVRDSLELPSSDDKTIAAEVEGIAQGFHVLAQLFEQMMRKDKPR